MSKFKSILFYFIFVLILAGLFSACYTPKKFSRQLSKGVVAYPEIMSNTCASLYPPKVESVKEIVYKEGKKDTIWEDIYLDCDTITEVVWKDRVVKVQVPKTITRVDTFIDHQYHTIENTALVASLKTKSDSIQNKLIECNIQKEETETKLNTWVAIGLILLAYLILKTIIRLMFPKLSIFLTKLP